MQTFTYYSYKGGTGRSLLLANTARYLALLGKKVVAIDFDLEAPGLHYKLNTSGPDQRPGDTTPTKGVVDYLHSIATGDGKAPDLRDHLAPVPLPHGTEGSLHLMPAGAAPTGAYWRTLTALLRQDFLTNPDGIAACLELQVRIEEDLEADFLLIDSRTGVTELAGLTTAVLADKVICLMLPNRESQSGARAVLRSLRHAERLPNRAPLDVVPVLSRVPDQGDEVLNRVQDFLNEPGPTPEDKLSLDRLFVLRSDPELGRSERLYLGTGEAEDRPGLHQDYVNLMQHLVEADPEKIAAANRRQKTIRHTRHWLTEDYEGHRHRSTTPNPFRAEQLDEGVLFRRAHTGLALRRYRRREPVSSNDEERYADLVAYAGEDRTEVLLAVEYVEDLEHSDAWIWWQDQTRLRCVVLVGTKESGNPQRRVFTRGRRNDEFVERGEFEGWAVRWPISFTALDDPGDRSVDSLLTAVQRGEDGFISLLVLEWQRASYLTLRRGAPFRPKLARRILDGLAQVENVETETHILWRTAPDPFERQESGFGREPGVRIEAMTTRHLHVPLWWRLSVEAKLEFKGSRWGDPPPAIEWLAETVLGLSFDQDRDLRSDLEPLVEDFDASDDPGSEAFRFLDLFQSRELTFRTTADPPPELIRRATLEDRMRNPRKDRSNEGPWDSGKKKASGALQMPTALKHLLRLPHGKIQVPTTDLLARYEPESATLLLFTSAIDACARLLSLNRRALANVAFVHEMIHALCHLGRDLDGRRWEEFHLPTALDPTYRPSALHETLAQFYTFKLIQRLDDPLLMETFEKLSDHQPSRYQTWRKMVDTPLESVRKILLTARATLDDTPWG